MENGIKVSAFFHDLIPIIYPRYVNRHLLKSFKTFLKTILCCDQLICNSKSTADELKDYLQSHPEIERNKGLRISYSLLGCDFFNHKEPPITETSRGKNGSESEINFIMVSTVEPRKMYAQAVKAFDILWKKGFKVNLWIVGRPGWKNGKTVSLIEKNPQKDKRLIWYKSGISDEELYSLYEKSDAVIFTSVAEGFGLAVAEGAFFKKPLILRDIPVFREIAGENAFYFSGTDEESLSQKIEEWIPLYESGTEPKSSKIVFRTWRECTSEILKELIET